MLSLETPNRKTKPFQNRKTLSAKHLHTHICIYIHTGILDLVSQIRLSGELKCSEILNDLSLRICKNMKLIIYKYS